MFIQDYTSRGWKEVNVLLNFLVFFFNSFKKDRSVKNENRDFLQKKKKCFTINYCHYD